MSSGLSEEKDKKFNIRRDRLKLLKTILLLTFFNSLLLLASPTKNYNVNAADTLTAQQVLIEASLFFEAFKIKQYEMWTIEKGFNVINNDPNFQNNKYKIPRRIDKVIFEVYNDSTTTDDLREVLADTALYLYDHGIQYDSEYAGTYLLKKAYILTNWKNVPVEEAVEAYEEAFSSGHEITNEVYYLAQLAGLYEDNVSDENDFQVKALDSYIRLSELEPENQVWQSKINNLAEDDEQLQGFMKVAWLADKENSEKAWNYAKMCKRNGDYESAIEPLQYLIDTNPEVINYWNEIARAYQKNDQIDMAVDSYKKLINLQPDNKDSYFNLALLYKNMGQLSVARSYLQKSAKVSPGWDYPLFIEAGLYEQAARNCGFEFEDKCVYQLAVETYRRVVRMDGEHASQASQRVSALSNSVPSKEDYFFRKLKNGDVIKIEGKCYDWIGKSITVSL